MKSVYICEKCGAQFTDYDKAYDCESGHLNIYAEMRGDFDPELKSRIVYKPASRFPEKCFFPVEYYDRESGEYKKTIAVYKFANELPETETATLFDAHDRRVEEENRRWREEWEKRQQEKAANTETA